MKRVICAVLAVMFIGLAQANEILRVGVDPNLKPFAYTEPDGSIHGFDIDIAKQVCQDLGHQCVFVPMEWDGLIPGLLSGKVDVIISAMSITEKRAKVVDFSNPYYKSPSQFMTLKGAGAPVVGDAVGVLRGSTDQDFATNSEELTGIKVISYGNQNEAMLDLTSGRLKAVLGPKIELQAGLIDTDKGEPFELTGPMYDDPKYYGPGIGMAVKKGRPDLLNGLNDSIRVMQVDGRWKAISDQYFDFDISAK
jgi:arginine/ornithine transport system substrate-binding protein